MASKTKKKSIKKRTVNGDRPRHGSKTASVARLLRRTGGCSAAEVLEQTGWPAVSMNAMAKACGLRLRKKKKMGEPIHYFGA